MLKINEHPTKIDFNLTFKYIGFNLNIKMENLAKSMYTERVVG